MTPDEVTKLLEDEADFRKWLLENPNVHFIAGDSCHCPIARWVKSRAKITNYSSLGMYEAYFKLGGKTYDNPDWVQDYIEVFDHRYKMKGLVDTTAAIEALNPGAQQ